MNIEEPRQALRSLLDEQKTMDKKITNMERTKITARNYLLLRTSELDNMYQLRNYKAEEIQRALAVVIFDSSILKYLKYTIY
jgi:hypothetical protein